MSMLWPLHKALVARLRADATLTALIPGGVHSGSAPTSAPRPYVVLTNPTEEEGAMSFGGYGNAATIQLDTFSATTVRSTQIVDQVLDRVEALLRTPVALEGHTQARARKEFRTVLVEDDETRHGLVRYGFVAAETP